MKNFLKKSAKAMCVIWLSGMGIAFSINAFDMISYLLGYRDLHSNVADVDVAIFVASMAVGLWGIIAALAYTVIYD